jgi:hypothetical protein
MNKTNTGIESEIQITEETFLERFRPRRNHLNPDASFDFGAGGCLYETFGEELAFVRANDPACIWTIIETDGELCIVSGYHFVNRLGYILCDVPVQDGASYVAEFDE